VLQRVAACCSVLQCVAVCCRYVQTEPYVAASCSVLQCVLLYFAAAGIYVLSDREFCMYVALILRPFLRVAVGVHILIEREFCMYVALILRPFLRVAVGVYILCEKEFCMYVALILSLFESGSRCVYTVRTGILYVCGYVCIYWAGGNVRKCVLCVEGM